MQKIGQNIAELFDSLSIAVCLSDVHLKIIFVNKHFEEFFGLPKDKVVGKSTSQFFNRSFKKLLENPSNFSNQIKFLYKKEIDKLQLECHLLPGNKREEKWFEYKAKFIEKGPYKGGLIEEYIDTTDLKKSQLILKQSENKYRNLVENSPVGVGISQNGKIIYSNPALTKIYGYSSKDELIDKPLINFVYKDDKEKVLHRMKLLAEGKAKYPYSMEHRIVDSNNKVRSISLQVSEFMKSGERFSQATFLDITEAKIKEFREKQLALEVVHLEHKSKIMREVEKQINSIINKNGYDGVDFNGLFNLFEDEIHFEKQWNFFKRKIDNIYPEFFKTLVEKHPCLTQKDLKHCALIKMSFDTKDIATILNVKPSSIQIARVRLKKKLNLTPNQDLKNYIMKI